MLKAFNRKHTSVKLSFFFLKTFVLFSSVTLQISLF